MPLARAPHLPVAVVAIPSFPALGRRASRPGPWEFAVLYALESMSRASLASVIPIQAYDLLQDKQAVSVLYVLIGIAGLVATVSVPILIQWMSRRGTYIFGALMIAAAALALATYTLPGQVIGMFLRILGAGTLAIALNLYILEFIPKHAFVRSESLRFAMATLPWTFGPGFGVWLYVEFGMLATYAWAGGWALLLVGYFLLLRLSAARPGRPGRSRPANPITSIKRFVAQPRLRLAWLIAFGRSCYWTTFYVYGPILMVSTGEGHLAGGLIVSMSNALLITAILWGRLGTRLGVRRVIVGCFVFAGICGCLAGVAGESHAWAAAILLLAGILSAVALDAIGSAPFLRAVHPYERPQMTAVYRTNLDLSDLLPALIYSVILGFTGLGGVFFALGLFSFVCAGVSWRYLPRSM